MLYDNNNIKLLGLKNVYVTNIEENKHSIYIYITQKKFSCTCPHCKNLTKYVYDYRKQKIKDLNIRGKPSILILNKRRLICKQCNKKFYQKPDFLPRYHRMTRRMVESIIHCMRSNHSMKDVAKAHNVSSYTVSRVFDYVSYKLNKLPTVLSIDEFKGNAGGEKFQAIITNPVAKRVLDILPNRNQGSILNYFRSFDSRKRVKFVVMDMWRPYYEISKILFPNATIIIDKYHYVRQVYWALERVRKRIQKDLSFEERIYFKRSKKILWKDYEKLDMEGKNRLLKILSTNDELDLAWQLKEIFVRFRKCKNSKEGKIELDRWLSTLKETNLDDFKETYRTFKNWYEPILNSLDYTYSNGFTEGCNNKIKVIKRNAYGLKNFNRFRNRIIHCCS